MQINLYRTTSDKRRLAKNLTGLIILDGTLRDDCNIQAPTVTIQAGADITGYNYMYIPAFGRYYFVESITAETVNIFTISGRCDVLMSYRPYILGVSGVVKRHSGESKSGAYIDDNSRVVDVRKTVQLLTFPAGLPKNPNYILITAGAVSV